MQSLCLPLLHDNYYPEIQPNKPADYSKPMQLLAQKLQFMDPITQQARNFSSHIELSLDDSAQVI
jgi:tRNA pseudouridine32 synthase/23S rRNA pseudouridine746 synthase